MSSNPIWDFFEKLPRDKTRALCKECGKTYSLGSDVPKRQTLTGLKYHMKMHQDKLVLYLKRLADRDVERLAKRMKKECVDVDYSNMFELPDLDMHQFNVVNPLPLCPNSDVQDRDLCPDIDLQNGDLTGIILNTCFRRFTNLVIFNFFDLYFYVIINLKNKKLTYKELKWP